MNKETQRAAMPKLNVPGAVVLDSAHSPGRGATREGAVVVARVDGSPHPYVTWWVDTDGNAFSGHYFMGYDEAWADFDDRRKRGY